jgi:hypothetical protein
MVMATSVATSVAFSTVVVYVSPEMEPKKGEDGGLYGMGKKMVPGDKPGKWPAV